MVFFWFESENPNHPYNQKCHKRKMFRFFVDKAKNTQKSSVRDNKH